MMIKKTLVGVSSLLFISSFSTAAIDQNIYTLCSTEARFEAQEQTDRSTDKSHFIEKKISECILKAGLRDYFEMTNDLAKPSELQKKFNEIEILCSSAARWNKDSEANRLKCIRDRISQELDQRIGQ